MNRYTLQWIALPFFAIGSIVTSYYCYGKPYTFTSQFEYAPIWAQICLWGGLVTFIGTEFWPMKK